MVAAIWTIHSSVDLHTCSLCSCFDALMTFTATCTAVMLPHGPGNLIEEMTLLPALSSLCRQPMNANQQLVSQLSAAPKAALAAAVEQCDLYAANPTTDNIYQDLISSVQEAGSLAGMLQRRGAGPLLHNGYALPPFQHKVDLAWLNMTPAEAQACDSGLLQRITAANTKLFGELPAPPSRPVLLQNLVDLSCADWGAVKLSFAAPAVQVEATAAVASAAVLSALLSGAHVAQAMARDDTAAASRAAEQASALAGAAVTHVHQLQAITAGRGQASADPVRGASSSGAGRAVPAGEAAAVPGAGAADAAATVVSVATGAAAHPSEQAATAAAAAGRGSSGVSTSDTLPAVPLLSAVAHLGAQLLSSPAPVAGALPDPVSTSSKPPPSAADTLQAAAAGAAELAEQLGRAAAPSTHTLRRGAGLLLLLPDSWGGKGRLLAAGRAVVNGQEFSHFSILQLMTTNGLLLQDGCTQTVSVRVAAEFIPAEQPRTGHWSKAAYTITVTPGSNLLLYCQPQHTWGQRFVAGCAAAARSFLALYDGLSDSAVAAALGEQWCQALLQLGFASDGCALAVKLIQQLQEVCKMGVFGIPLPDLVQLPSGCALTSDQVSIVDAKLVKCALQLCLLQSYVMACPWTWTGCSLCVSWLLNCVPMAQQRLPVGLHRLQQPPCTPLWTAGSHSSGTGIGQQHPPCHAVTVLAVQPMPPGCGTSGQMHCLCFGGPAAP